MLKHLTVFCCSAIAALALLGVQPLSANVNDQTGPGSTLPPACCTNCPFSDSRAMCQGFCSSQCYGVDYTACMTWCHRNFKD